MPELFADSGWERLNTTVLSTSNCGNPSLRHFGFGPVSAEGFGIGYIIKDDSISVCMSSKHRQTKRFIDSLESYLLEMRKLIRSVQRTSSAGKASRAREVEERPPLNSRQKSRGNLVRGLEHGKTTSGLQTPTTDSGEVEDEGLGGCKCSLFSPMWFARPRSTNYSALDGFFDAGMLLNALKADKERPSDTAAQRRRAVGRKLRLEY